ncbi:MULTISPECIES: hypothetical protein [Rhizobium/Agrobacterium group]|jgi:hypothetical protein|uniref:hypothetical protein n=1 Tax=Rhizobium/Agrobacterium group TaxID=227290 RepID=UPI001050406B|nr:MULTISPECIES: hypothetical protein [Rhizobium/Agrobacterium group]TCR90974.1 hypothetical protein EV561_103368 [Rhizobium sp. BK376]
MARRPQKNAYRAGASAFLKGMGGEHNPHASESADCKAWEHGYLDRQKMLSNTRRPVSSAGRQPVSRPTAH